jgi:FkbM family methyltransferase
MPLLPRLIQSLEAIRRFENPVHVLRKRLFGKPQDIMILADRKSGIHCSAKVSSYNMFVETWYSRDYDVPFLQIDPGDVVIDIGANQGFFTCYAAHRGAYVYPFEPNPDNYERLVSNIERNGLTGRVIARPWAISSTDGSAQLMVSSELGGGMSTIVPAFAKHTQISITDTVSVSCYGLSHVLDMFSLSHVRLCKIDAEGSELEILRALPVQRARTIDSFAAEVHPEAYEIQELLRLLLGWGTHQVSFNEQGAFSARILRAVSNQALLRGF